MKSMKTVRAYYLFIPIIVFMLTGCLSSIIGTTGDKFTPKQNAIWMNNVYLSEYKAYPTAIEAFNQSVAAKPDSELTEEELNKRNKKRDLFAAKKQILIELKPALLAYSSYVDIGKLAPDDVEALTIKLIQKLINTME